MGKGKQRGVRKNELVHLVMGVDGGPADGFYDDCPVCRELARTGQTVHTIDAHGGLVELVPPAVLDEGILVALELATPFGGFERVGALNVPHGCRVWDFREMVRMFPPPGLPVGSLDILVNGVPPAPGAVLREGDVVQIVGDDRGGADAGVRCALRVPRRAMRG
jgi:hypothetical protein